MNRPAMGESGLCRRAALSNSSNPGSDSTALSGQESKSTHPPRYVEAAGQCSGYLLRLGLNIDRLKRSIIAWQLHQRIALQREGKRDRFRCRDRGAIIGLCFGALVGCVGLSPLAGASLARKRGRPAFAGWRRADVWNRHDRSGDNHCFGW